MKVTSDTVMNNFFESIRETIEAENAKKQIKINKDFKFTFGKYKDKRILQVRNLDPFYVNWLINESEINFLIEKDFFAILNKEIVLESYFVMPLGKHKGLRLDKILEKDFNYFEWLYADLFEKCNCKLGKGLHEKFEKALESLERDPAEFFDDVEEE